ncbi:MAG TPA: hypothetical protein VII29_02980 [Terriglobales bacterium]|jgi:hypothetical protein
MTFAEIQRAIEGLAEDEQAKLATWMASRDRALWDAEIERDFSASGAGSVLLENVRQQVNRGESRPFAEGPRRA